MRATVNNGRRQKSLLRSDIFQMFIGLLAALFLFQTDRMISGQSADAYQHNSVVGNDAMTVGIRVVRLECDYAVAVPNRVVRIETSPCRYIPVYK